jgi:hypothetical protein
MSCGARCRPRGIRTWQSRLRHSSHHHHNQAHFRRAQFRSCNQILPALATRSEERGLPRTQNAIIAQNRPTYGSRAPSKEILLFLIDSWSLSAIKTRHRLRVPGSLHVHSHAHLYYNAHTVSQRDLIIKHLHRVVWRARSPNAGSAPPCRASYFADDHARHEGTLDVRRLGNPPRRWGRQAAAAACYAVREEGSQAPWEEGSREQQCRLSVSDANVGRILHAEGIATHR